MKIYTKKGDLGDTGLFGGARVAKDDLRIRSYGTLDELNAVLGELSCLSQEAKRPPTRSAEFTELDQIISILQAELFQLGSELATPRGKVISIALLEISSVERLEYAIDQMESCLTPLKNFILPGGSLLAAKAHLARTVCRRAEREMVTLHRAEPLRAVVLQYVNRLSDYLFVLARYFNFLLGVEDRPWVP